MYNLAQGREAVLLAIVDRLAVAEGKATDAAAGFSSFTYDRAWLMEAFAVARDCLNESK